MTRRELVLMSKEFIPHKTYIFSLFLKALLRHKKYLYGSILNTNETLMTLPLTNSLRFSSGMLTSSFVSFC